MNIDEILTLVQAVSDSKLTSFKLDQGDMHISLKKEKEDAKIITVSAPGAVAAVPASTAAPVLTAASTSVSTEIPAAAPEAAEHHDIASDKVITSPLVGTFYRCRKLCKRRRYCEKRPGTWHYRSNEADERDRKRI